MISRINNFKNEHKFILQCNISTTTSQIESFVQRAFFDKFRNVYFVMDPQQLSVPNQQYLLQQILSLHNSINVNEQAEPNADDSFE